MPLREALRTDARALLSFSHSLLFLFFCCRWWLSWALPGMGMFVGETSLPVPACLLPLLLFAAPLPPLLLLLLCRA